MKSIPWKVGKSYVAGSCTIDTDSPERKTPYDVGGISIYGNGIETICHLSWDAYDRGEVESHANLIAASPELMEACKEASELLTAGGLGQDKPLIEKLNRAIAKAEGREP